MLRELAEVEEEEFISKDRGKIVNLETTEPTDKIVLLIACCVMKVWKIVLIYVFVVQVVFTVGGKRSSTVNTCYCGLK